MSRVLKVTILGCGSSTGVPRIGGLWGACDPAEPRNVRRRASALVEIGPADGPATVVLIDTSPDCRSQLLDAGVTHVDAVFYTHDHADQTHGIDDLRQLVALMERRVPVHADGPTLRSLKRRFGYCFETPAGSFYKPILEAHPLPPDGHVTVEGPGGPLRIRGIELDHGNMMAQGYILEGRVAYSPDVHEVPEPAFEALAEVECWICDALQMKTHPTHSHVDKTLGWFERMRLRKGVLTNLHLSLDYRTLRTYVPDHVDVAYDGMTLSFETA